MFTGIVEELGTVLALSKRGGLMALSVEAPLAASDARVGDSIAVNGACLTVTACSGSKLQFDIMAETLDSTVLGGLRRGEKVNCERSLKATDRISGHFVTGHVDCAGVIRKKSSVRSTVCFEIAVPAEFLGWCVSKGSVSVDGISLTISGRTHGSFAVCIIPHTLKNTTLGFKGPSDRVNVEFDMLVKRGVAQFG